MGKRGIVWAEDHTSMGNERLMDCVRYQGSNNLSNVSA